MAIVGVVTNTGLAEAVKVSSNKGWSIFPTRFGVSATGGDMRPTRTDPNTMWFDAPITDQTVVSENTIQFVCTIPPQVIETDNHIREIYLFGENSETGGEFLLAIGQPTEAITYFRDGSITLRMHVTLANVQASQVFEFKYTGHRSIEDHNTDVHAHREIIGTLTDQIRSLGESILVDGQISSGGAVYVDRETGRAQIDEAKFYKNGELLTVPRGEFTVPLSGAIGVGVWMTTDADGLHTLAWGTRYDGSKGDSFHEVHLIEDGYLKTVSAGVVVEEPVHTSVIRYDREANGSYIVRGLKVRAMSADNATYDLQVAEGKAHIDGLEVGKRRVSNLHYDYDPDTQLVLSERHVFQPDEKGEMAVNVDNQPLSTLHPVAVTYTKSATLGIDRGQSRGTQDFVVPNLLKVKSIRYGTSTFLEGRDFLVRSPYIDWSPAGAEPPTGVLYTAEVEYLNEAVIAPEEVAGPGFVFAGAIPDTSFQVQYHTLLPRKDLIVLSRDGALNRIKGKGDTRNLTLPKVPEGSLALAEINHHWIPGVAPGVENTGILAVRASELTAMQQQIADLYDLMAEERIARAAENDDPRAKRGVFVDPFIDDEQRDGGAIQTAMVDTDAGELTLAFDVHTMDTLQLNRDHAPNGLVMLPYNLRTIFTQDASTGHMLVNPYSAFDPIPPAMSLNPSVDNWTIQRTTRTTISRTQQRTSRITAGNFNRQFGRNGQTTQRAVNRASQTLARNNELPHLRELRVSFEIKGFAPSEQLKALTFGSIDVTDSLGDFGMSVVKTKLLIADNRLLDMRPLFSSPSISVTSWRRGAQVSSGTRTGDLSVWQVRDGRTRCASNTGSFVSLTSVDTYDNFDVTVRVRGENDDDWIGLVMAAVQVGNKLHTLSALHATRTNNAQRWLVVQDYGQSSRRNLMTDKSSATPYKGNWSAQPDGATIRIRRRGDIIEVWSSGFNSRVLLDASRYTIDLRSDPKLAVFRSPGAWGFAAHSNVSNFEVLSHTNNGNLG